MFPVVDISKDSVYHENLINNSFKTILDNKRRIQVKLITVPKKPLSAVHPYLRPL